MLLPRVMQHRPHGQELHWAAALCAIIRGTLAGRGRGACPGAAVGGRAEHHASQKRKEPGFSDKCAATIVLLTQLCIVSCKQQGLWEAAKGGW